VAIIVLSIVYLELLEIFLVTVVLVPERVRVVLVEAPIFSMGCHGGFSFQRVDQPPLLSLISAAVLVVIIPMARRNYDCININAVPRCIGVLSGVRSKFSCQAAVKRAQGVMMRDVVLFISPNVPKTRG